MPKGIMDNNDWPTRKELQQQAHSLREACISRQLYLRRKNPTNIDDWNMYIAERSELQGIIDCLWDYLKEEVYASGKTS